jgi:hypothetical protein
MPLIKENLKNAIKAAYDAESNKEVTPAEARERTAQAIADAVDSYIKAGVVTVDPSSHTGTIA